MGQGKLPIVFGFSDSLYDSWADRLYEKLGALFEVNLKVYYDIGDAELMDLFFYKNYGYTKEGVMSLSLYEAGTTYGTYGLDFDIVSLGIPEHFALNINSNATVEISGYYHTPLWGSLIEYLREPTRLGYHRNGFFHNLEEVSKSLRKIMPGLGVEQLIVHGDYENLVNLEAICSVEKRLSSFDDILIAAERDGVLVFDLDDIIEKSQQGAVAKEELFMTYDYTKIALVLRG